MRPRARICWDDPNLLGLGFSCWHDPTDNMAGLTLYLGPFVLELTLPPPRELEEGNSPPPQERE